MQKKKTCLKLTASWPVLSCMTQAKKNRTFQIGKSKYKYKDISNYTCQYKYIKTSQECETALTSQY